MLFEKIQFYVEKTLSNSKREARQVTLDHIDPMCSLSLSLCSSYIGLLALILLPKPHIVGICVSYLVNYAYPCSFESCTSLYIICDVEFGLCL
jgi:hypothetical protein